jgi:hypothetical protein
MDHMFSLGEVARLLGVQGYRISYAIRTGAVPDTAGRLAGKRVFTAADVNRLAAHFGVGAAADNRPADAEEAL